VVADPRAASGAGRSGVGPSPPNPLSRSASEGASRDGKLRPLNQPRPVVVETDERGVPTTIVVSKFRRAVESVLEKWRIDDEWWRTQRVSRTYWRLLLEDGRTVDVYRDLARNRWYRQAYAG
jgi:hypothetical protein